MRNSEETMGEKVGLKKEEIGLKVKFKILFVSFFNRISGKSLDCFETVFQ